MVRGTRYLLVRNLPEKSTEESIISHFQRYGKIQSVRVHNGKENEGGATVAFMDIKSAAKAHNAENNVDGSVVQTEYCEGTATGSVVTRTREPERGGYHTTATPRSNSSSFTGWQKGQEENSRHETAESGELPPPNNFSTDSEFIRSRPREAKYEKFNQNRQGTNEGVERHLSRSKSGSRSPNSRSHSSSSDSSSSDSSSPSQSRSASPNSMRPPGQKRSSSQAAAKDKDGKLIDKAASEAGSSSTQPTSSDKRQVGICVTKLPLRSSDTSLRDGLFHEYKKHGKVTSVQVISDEGERYAIVSFRKPEDATKAMEASQEKMFFGTKIHVLPHDGVEVDDADFRPIETELDEYHPKSTRTLFVGNLEKDTSIQELVDKFKPFGEIIDVDIKRQGAASAYAFVQYADIVSVVKSLRAMEGEHIGANKIKLGFGKSMPTNCVWLDNIGENVGDNFLLRVFSRYGEVNYSVIDRVKSRSLVYFTNMDNAIYATSEMRNRSLGGKKVQIDFASRECQNKFFDKMESSGQLRAGERPDERGRGGTAAVHRTQSRDYENFSDDSRGSYSQTQTLANRNQPFFRGGRSGSRGSSSRFRTGEPSTFNSEEYSSRRSSRHSDEYSNSGDYYKADDTYEQELREYDRSRRERRERGGSSPRRDERHLSISFDDRSHRSRDVSLDRYDERSNKDHFDHYRDSDSAGSDRNSYNSDSKYHARSVDDKSYSHGKYVSDKGRHDLDIIGDGDDGSRSHSPSSFHSPSRTPVPRRSSTPPTPTEAEPPMYRSSYYGDTDYKRKSRIDKPTEFVQHPVQSETVSKSLHSVVCKPVTDVQKQDKSANRKRSYEAMLSKDTLRSDYKIPRKIDSTISSLVTKTSNSQERSRIEKKLYHTDKKLEKAKYAKQEKLLLPVDASFILSSSPGSSGSRPDSENGSMGELDLLKLTQEKKTLLQKLQQLEDGGSTSDNESNEDVRNVIARNQKSALTKQLFLRDNIKPKDRKIDSTKYRTQMDKLRKLHNVKTAHNVKTVESSVKINFNGDESDTEEYADDSPKDVSPEFRQTKRQKFDKESDSVAKSRGYRRKGSTFSSDDDMDVPSHKKPDSYAGRLHRIDSNSGQKRLIGESDEIQNKSKVQDSKLETSDHPVPNLLSPKSTISAQSPDKDSINLSFARPSDSSRSNLRINIGSDCGKSGDIASPMSPPISGDKHLVNSINNDLSSSNSEELSVPTDPRLDEKRLASDSLYTNRLMSNSIDDPTRGSSPKHDDSLSDSSIEEPKVPGELSISERIALLDAQLDKTPDAPAVPSSGLPPALTQTPTFSSNIQNYASKFKIKKRLVEGSANSANVQGSDNRNEPSEIIRQLMNRHRGSILDQDSQRLEERKTTPSVKTKAEFKEISIHTNSGHWHGPMGGMRFQPAPAVVPESSKPQISPLQSDHLASNMTSIMAASPVVQPGKMSLSPGSQYSTSSSPFHPSQQSPQLQVSQPANQFCLPKQTGSCNSVVNTAPMPSGNGNNGSQHVSIMPAVPSSALGLHIQPCSNHTGYLHVNQVADHHPLIDPTTCFPVLSHQQSISQPSPPISIKPTVSPGSLQSRMMSGQQGSFQTSPQSIQTVFGSQVGFQQPIRPEAMKPTGLFSKKPSEAIANIQIQPTIPQEFAEGSLATIKRIDSTSSSGSPAFPDKRDVFISKCQPPVLKKEVDIPETFISHQQFSSADHQQNKFGINKPNYEDDRFGNTLNPTFEMYDKKQNSQIGFQHPVRPEAMKPSGLFSRRPSDAVASVQIPPGMHKDMSDPILLSPGIPKRIDSASIASLSSPSLVDKRETVFVPKSQPPVLKKENVITETLGAPIQPLPVEPQSISSTTVIKSGTNRSKSEDDRPSKSSKTSTSHSSSFELFQKKIEIFHEKKPEVKKHQESKDHGKKDKTDGKEMEKSGHSKSNTSPDKKSKSKEGEKKELEKKHEKDKSRHHSGNKSSKEKDVSSSKEKSKSSKSKDGEKKERDHASSSDKSKEKDAKKKEKKSEDKKDEKKSDEKHSDKKHDDKDKKNDDKKPDKKDKSKHQDTKPHKTKSDSTDNKSDKNLSKSSETKTDKSSKDQKEHKKHSSHNKDKGGKEAKDGKSKAKDDKNKDSGSKDKEKERDKKKKERERSEKHAKEKEKEKEEDIPYEIPPELEPFISMYDKVKRRSCIKKKEEHEEVNRSSFKRFKKERKKKHNPLSDNSDFSMELSDSDSATSPGIMSDVEKPKKEVKKKKRPVNVLDSLSSDEEHINLFKVKKKKKTKPTSTKTRKIFDSTSESDKTMDYQSEESEEEYLPVKPKKSPVKKRKSRESSEVDSHDQMDNKNRILSSEMSITEPETMDEGEKKDLLKIDKDKKVKKKKETEDLSKEAKSKSKSLDAVEPEAKLKHDTVKTKAELKKVECFDDNKSIKKPDSKKTPKEHKKSSKSKQDDKEKTEDIKPETKSDKPEAIKNKKEESEKPESANKLENQKIHKKTDTKKDDEKKNNSHKHKEDKEMKKDPKSDGNKEFKTDLSKDIRTESKDSKSKSDKKKKKHSKSSSKSMDSIEGDHVEKKPIVEDLKVESTLKIAENEIKKEKLEDSNKLDFKIQSPGKSEMKVKTKAEMKEHIKPDVKHIKSEKKEHEKLPKHEKTKADNKVKTIKTEKIKSKSDNKKVPKVSKPAALSLKDQHCEEEHMEVSVIDNLQNSLLESDQPSKAKKAKLVNNVKVLENLFAKFGPGSEIYSSRDEDSENEDSLSAKKNKKKKAKKHKKGEKSSSPKITSDEPKEDSKKSEVKGKEDLTETKHKKEKKKVKKQMKERSEQKPPEEKPQPVIKPKPKLVDPFDFDDKSESNDSMPIRPEKAFPDVLDQADRMEKHETMSESTTEEAIDSVGEKLNDTDDEKCPDSPKIDDHPEEPEPPQSPKKQEGLFDKFFEAVHMKKLKNSFFVKKPDPLLTPSASETSKDVNDKSSVDATKDSSKETSSPIKSPINEDNKVVASSTSPAITLSTKTDPVATTAVSSAPTLCMSPTKTGFSSCLSPFRESIPSMISPLKSPITATSPSRSHTGSISSTKPCFSPSRAAQGTSPSPGRSPHSGRSPLKPSPYLSPPGSPVDPIKILSPKSTVLPTSISPMKIPVLTSTKPVTPTKNSVIIPEINSNPKTTISPEVSSTQNLETPFMDEIDSDEREKAVQEASDEAARAVESLLQDSSDPDPFGFSTPERTFPDPAVTNPASIEDLVFPDVNFSDAIAAQSSDENKILSPARRTVRNRRQSKGSKGSKDDSDTAPETTLADFKSQPVIENEDLLETGDLKIDFDHLQNDTDSQISEKTENIIPNDTEAPNQPIGPLSSLDDSFNSASDDSKLKSTREGRGRGKGRSSRRGRGQGTRKSGVERLPVPTKDNQIDKDRPQFGSPIKTEPLPFFDISQRQDSDSLLMDDGNQVPLMESFHPKEVEAPSSDTEKTDIISYKEQRPTRKRKQTNYKDIHAGITPNSSQSPRTRAAVSPRAGTSVLPPVTSPRTRAAVSSPRAQRSGMTVKPVTSPRGQKSPKYSEIVSPVVKLEIMDINKSKKKEEAKKNIFNKEQNVTEEEKDMARITTPYEDWKNSLSLLSEKSTVSKENVYEFEESEDFNTEPCPSLRLRNTRKKAINEHELAPLPVQLPVKTEEPVPIVAQSSDLQSITKKDSLQTVNMDLQKPIESVIAHAYGSDDSSASMSNVERIIDAVSRGLLGSADKSDEEDDDEPKLHIAIGSVPSPPVTTKSEVESLYSTQFIFSGTDYLDKTPPRMDITSPPLENSSKPEITSDMTGVGPHLPINKSSPDSISQIWSLTYNQTLPFKPILTSDTQPTKSMHLTSSPTTSVVTSSSLSSTPERTMSQPIGPAPALIPSPQSGKVSQATVPISHISLPSSAQKSPSVVVATSAQGTISSRSMPSPLLPTQQHKVSVPTWSIPLQPILTPPPSQISPNSQPQRSQSVQLPVQHMQHDNIVQRPPSVHGYSQIQLQMQQQQLQQYQQLQQQIANHQKQLQHQQQKTNNQDTPVSRESKEPKRQAEKSRSSGQSGGSPYQLQNMHPAHSSHGQSAAPGFMLIQNQMQRPAFPNDGIRHGMHLEHPRPGITGELPKHGLPGESALHSLPGHLREPGERRHPSLPGSHTDQAHQQQSHNHPDRSRHSSGDHAKHIDPTRHPELRHNIPNDAARLMARPAHAPSPLESRGMLQPMMVPTSAHQQRKTPTTPDSSRMKMTPPVTFVGPPRSLSPKSSSPVGQPIERIQNPVRQIDHHGMVHHVNQQQGNFSEPHLVRKAKEIDSTRLHGDARNSMSMFMSQAHQQRVILQQQQEAASAAQKSGQMPDPVHRGQATSPSTHPMMSHHAQQQSPLNLAESDSRTSRDKPASRNPQHAFSLSAGYAVNAKHLPSPSPVEQRPPQSKTFLQPPAFHSRALAQTVPPIYGVEMPGFPPGPFGVRIPVDAHSVYQRELYIQPGREAIHSSGFPTQILSPHPGYPPLEAHARTEQSSPLLHRQEPAMGRPEIIRSREGPKSMESIFQRFPVMWHGQLALKNDSSFVQMHFVAGNQGLVKLTLPQISPMDQVPLRIAQRMRMEQSQLEGVSKRMQMDSDYCLLLAVPCGRDPLDISTQTKGLTEGFIQYLQQKQAAGIVNIPMPGSQQPAYVVHIFPPCEFSHDAVLHANPVLFDNIRDSPHVVIIIVHCDASHP